MRDKLIKLLRKIEKYDGFHNNFNEFNEFNEYQDTIDEYIDFPNYRFVIKEFYKKNPTNKNGVLFSGNEVKAELKRMEADGLVMITIQGNLLYSDVHGRQIKGKVEGIILTTKGKSEWRYFWYKATENPITTTVSLTAIIISIIALFL